MEEDEATDIDEGVTINLAMADDDGPHERVQAEAPVRSWRVERTTSEPLRKVVPGRRSFFYSHPEGPKLRNLSEDQNYKGPVQKTQWRSRTSCRKFW